MTPGEFARAVDGARKRDYRLGMPAASLAAFVAQAFAGEGSPKPGEPGGPPTVEDFLGPSPFSSEPAPSAEEARLARYAAAQERVRKLSEAKRQRRERERQPRGPNAAPPVNGAGGAA